ncbi:MAG: hypothetical protein FWG21_01470, partial [Oscillospiraceae bacterium]|nr:hypothetical protein [Oscillospiraceae bacterium]
LADKYDEDAQFCSIRANERIKQSTEDVMRSSVIGYSSVTLEYSDIRMLDSSVKYALMPVWMLATKWRDNSYLFAMNGQTGKLVGDLPVNRGLYWRWLMGITASIVAAVAVILAIMY